MKGLPILCQEGSRSEWRHPEDQWESCQRGCRQWCCRWWRSWRNCLRLLPSPAGCGKKTWTDYARILVIAVNRKGACCKPTGMSLTFQRNINVATGLYLCLLNTYICTYVHTDTHTHTCACTHIHTHTHTHTISLALVSNLQIALSVSLLFKNSQHTFSGNIQTELYCFHVKETASVYHNLYTPTLLLGLCHTTLTPPRTSRLN